MRTLYQQERFGGLCVASQEAIGPLPPPPPGSFTITERDFHAIMAGSVGGTLQAAPKK